MVAIVAGQGLGLQNTSKELLGGGGVLGSASQGVTGEGVYVNAATGNLVVRQQDEWLVGVGPDAGITRTYNSLGAGTDDNGDNWQLGLSRRITGVTGGSGVNTAGSSVKRVGEDGVEEGYTWDAVRTAYVSKSGSGAYDTLKYSTSTAERPYEGWTWTDGDTQQVEHYAGTSGAGAKLKSVVDRDGNKIDLTYDSTRANLISKIRTTNGSGGAEEIEVTYFANKNNIESLITKYVDGEGAQSQTKTLKRVTYGYDNSDRLNSVKVDLTPDDLQDTKSVETRYTYHEGTKRLKTLEQFSGEVSLSKLAFEYVSASDGRLKSIKEWVNGQELLTQLEYTAAGLTKVKDALGQYTEIAYNDSGATTAADKQLQLKSIKLPTATQALVSYEYDDSGNVMKVTDGRGGETIYRYDSQGNRVYERNAEGNVIERSYGSANELLSETVYAVSDPDTAGAQLAGKPQTTYHVYDAKLHLRYVVNPQGQVTEHRYNELGQRTSTLRYTQGSFTVGASAPDWGSDLIDAGASGWSITGTAYRFVNGKLEVTSKNQATTESNWARPLESKALGSTWRIEFRTPTSLNAVKPVSLGIDATASGEDSRMYRLLIDGNNFKVISSKGSAWSPTRTLGAIQPDKDYVLEIVTQASGELQMYVYEASKDRSGGFMDAANLGTWSGTKFQFDTAVNASAASPSVTYVFDNLKAKSAGAALPTESALTNWRDNSLDAAQKTAIARTDYGYDTRGQLKTQTQFTQVSTAGEGVANGNEVKVSYTYDQSGNLLSKAEVGADGLRNVTSYAYDGLNRLKVLTDAASKQTQTEYLDASRQVKVTSANGLVTTTTYDEAGHVLTVSQSDPQAQQALQSLGTTKYSYDKLGRLIATELPSGQKSYIVYDGQGRKAADVDAEFALTEYRYNALGQVVQAIRYAKAVPQAARASLPGASLAALQPPASDDDRRQWRIYDAVGRLSATVTSVTQAWETAQHGAVEYFRYDAAGQQIASTRYATLLDAQQMALIKDATVELVASPGQIKVGSQTIRLTGNAADRVSRQFFDAQGRVVGKLDGENFYTEYKYDAAGRLVRTSRYATAMAGTLADELTPPAVVSTAIAGAHVLRVDASVGGLSADEHTYFIRDNAGRVVAEIDAESYVTTYTYDPSNNLKTQTRHALQATASASDGAINLGKIEQPQGGTASRYVKASGNDRTTSNDYDQVNRLKRTTVQPQGLVTEFTYDDDGHLTQTVTGVGQQERTSRRQCDKLGRVTHELSAQGALQLAALGSNATAEAKQAVWDEYSTRYVYDKDLLIARIEPNGSNGDGLKTLYYYDQAGRVTHSVNALGEVSSHVYNLFGEAIEERRHSKRLGSLSGLTGGLKTTAVQDALNATQDSTADIVVSMSYTRGGQLQSRQGELSNEWFFYNAFGEVSGSGRSVLTGGDFIDERDLAQTYDRRGLLTASVESDGSGGAQRAHYLDRDAFGRVTSSSEPGLVVQSWSYDRLGRQIEVSDPLASAYSTLRSRTTYDAFGRVLSMTDTAGTVTTLEYDDAAKALKTTVDLKEGLGKLETTTYHDVHGQVVKVVDGQGNRQEYTYDRDGQLLTKRLYDAQGQELNGVDVEKAYDKAGRVKWSREGHNRVDFTYDSANRVLTRSSDTGEGETLVTQYRYDAMGQTAWVRDARGVWTHTEFDQGGRVVAVTVDPAVGPDGGSPRADALNQVSRFEYSWGGLLVRQIQGADTADAQDVSYEYDVHGRRVAEVIDPSGLKLRTRYVYDDHDNVVARINAAQQVTRYVYDAGNRLSLEIDATGAVTSYAYGSNGKLSRKIAYSQRVSVQALPEQVSADQVLALLPAAPQDADQVSYSFYDGAGRLILSIDPTGHAMTRVYDSVGNVIRLIRHANKVNNQDVVGVVTDDRLDFQAPELGDEELANLLQGTTVPYLVESASDQTEQFVYDGANRLLWKVDALGYATNYVYLDGQTQETRFANAAKPVQGAAQMGLGEQPQVVTQAPANATGAYIVQDSAKDQVTKREYDKLGRLTQVTDALNYITRRSYDGAGRLKSETRYDQQGSTSEAAGAAVTSYAYDGAGNLTEVTDAEGVKTRHKYDAAGNRVETTVAYDTPDASTTGYTYDDAGRLTAETRAKGTSDEATTSYVLNALGQRKEIIDALNHKTTQDFDAAGRVWQVTDPLGGKTITEYDAFGNAIKVTDPNGNAGYFFFDANNRNTWQVDPMGYATKTVYDAFWQAHEITKYDGAVKGTLSTSTKLGAYASAQDATAAGSTAYVLVNADKDAKTTIWHDKLGRQTQIQDAEGHTEEMAYDGLGNKVKFTNKLSGVFTYTHDLMGRVLTETQPVTVKQYDAQGQPKVNGSPIQNLANTEFLVVTRFQYDSRGNVVKKTEAEGLAEQRVTEYGYDKLDRLKTTQGEKTTIYTVAGGPQPDQVPTETRTYDKRGNLIEIKTADGGTTRIFYDDLNRETLRFTSNRLEGSTLHGLAQSQGYDAAGNLKTLKRYASHIDTAAPWTVVSDGQTRTVRYDYDLAGRQTDTYQDDLTIGEKSASEASGYRFVTGTVHSTKAYDKAGNVVKEVDGRGNVTYSYHNALGQRTLQVDAARYVTQWTYDEAGNTISQTRYAKALPADDTAASWTLGVDTPVDTILSKIPSPQEKRVQEFDFDRMGRKVEERTLNVAYAEVDALSGNLTDKTGTVRTKYAYDGLGNVTQRTSATQEVTDLEYDKQGRLTRTLGAKITAWDNPSLDVRPTQDTEYNGLGLEVRSIQRGTDKLVETDDRITFYRYDSAGHRISETDPEGYVTQYAHDILGRITRRDITRVDADGVTHHDRLAMTLDHQGQQVERITASRKDSAPDYTQLQTEQIAYNAFGDITAKGTQGGNQRRIDYDNAGRVWRTNDTAKGAVTVYYYDANGNATLEVTSSQVDLMDSSVLAESSANSVLALQNATGLNPKVNVYDSLNRLVDSYLPESTTVKQQVTVQPRQEIIHQDPFDGGQVAAHTNTDLLLQKYVVPPSGVVVLGVTLPNLPDKVGNWEMKFSYPPMGPVYVGTEGGVWKKGFLTRDFKGVASFRLVKNLASGGVADYGVFSFEGLLGSSANWFSRGLEKNRLIISGFSASAEMVRIKYRKLGTQDSYSQKELSLDPRAPGLGQFAFDLDSAGIEAVDYEYQYIAFNDSGEEIDGAAGVFFAGSPPSIKSREKLFRPEIVRNYVDWLEGAAVSKKTSSWHGAAYNAYGEVIRQSSNKRTNNDQFAEIATEFDYNALGKVIQKKDPQVSVTHVNGTRELTNPTTKYYYDAEGRLIGTRDANQNLTTYRLQAGSTAEHTIVLDEFHADRALSTNAQQQVVAGQGVKRQRYDVFGQLKRSINENWDGVADLTPFAITYGYNKNGDLTSIDRPGAADENYTVDSQGQRIKTLLAPSAQDNGTRYTEATHYDGLGRVVKTVSAANRVTSYGYEWVAAIAGGGGWRRRTTTADGTLIDDIDTFDRLRWHRDLGNHAFTYRYNGAGLLISQTSLGTDDKPSGLSEAEKAALQFTGQDISFSYYDNGLVKDTIDNARKSWTKYRYDERGNRIFEGYARNLNTDASPAWEYYQYSEAEYDDAGRLTRVWDPKSDIKYEYDAAGNRRRVLSKYHDGANGGLQTQDYWYTYDSMNRFLVTMGTLDVGLGVVRGTDGKVMTYDHMGQRKSANTSSGLETYSYDAEGFLEEVKLDGSRIAFRDNDARGNVMRLEETTRSTGDITRHFYQYDADNILQNDYESVKKAGAASFVNTSYTSMSLLASGTLNSSVRTQYKDNGTDVSNTITTTYQYVLWDERKQSRIEVKGTVPYKTDRTWDPGSTTLRYDVNGHIERTTDLHGNRHFYYSTDADGRVLRREELDNADAMPSKQNRSAAERSQLFFQNYYFFNGREVGTVSSDPGAIRKDYSAALAQRSNAAMYERRVVLSADFDQNYQPIGTNYPARTSNTYTVASDGESLQGIALAMWGDGSLWYLIAEANGLLSTDSLVQGQRLVIPNKVTNIHNNTSTFRPYDASQALGDIQPTLPDAPPPATKKGKCGGMGQVLMIVVAVVATVLTAGAAAVMIAGQAMTLSAVMTAAGSLVATAGIGGAMAAAAIGGAVGSIASQAVGMATGDVQKFSWSSVASSAISGAVTAGMPAMGAGWTGAAMRAAASSVVSQGVNMAVGLQKKFDWRSVAASAAGGAISYGLTTDSLGQSIAANSMEGFGRRVVSGVLSGVARSAIYDQRPDWASIAASSFGSALGDSIVATAKDYTLPEAIRGMSPQARQFAHNAIAKGMNVQDPEQMTALQSTLEAQFQGKALTDAERYGNTQVFLNATVRDPNARALAMGALEDSGVLSRPPTTDEPTPQNPTDRPLAPIEVKAPSLAPTDTALGAKPLDRLANNTGAFVKEVEATIQSKPWLGYAMEALSFAAAPLAFLGQKALAESPIGKAIEAVKQRVNDAISDRFVDAGYTDDVAENGGTGVMAVTAMALGAVPKSVLGFVTEMRGIKPGHSFTLSDTQAKYPKVILSKEIEAKLGPAPDGMKEAHRHHVLDVNGRSGAHRALVREGQDILRQYNIDPLHGVENLTWAPNKGHTLPNTESLVDRLRSARDLGLPRDEIVKILRNEGLEAKNR